MLLSQVRRQRGIALLQADAEHGKEAEKQPFLIWEDRGGVTPAHAEDVLSEDDQPAEPSAQVSSLAPILPTACHEHCGAPLERPCWSARGCTGFQSCPQVACSV